MKNGKITLACLMAASVLAFASCKKTDNSVHARMTGKWKTYKSAIDANNNGVMDASEEDVPTSSTYVIFSSDGTGKSEDSVGTVKGTFTWTLKNNDADFVIKETSGSSAGQQNNVHIDALTSTDLNISQVDSATSIKFWVMMKKQ